MGWYNFVILLVVKTAVSIPDSIFEAADQMAKRLGLSRSELYARALVKQLSDEVDDAVTARLDAVYSSEKSDLPPALADDQRRRLRSIEW